MPATLTLNNIPDDVYQRLRAYADAHRRLNSEVIVCRETALNPGQLTAEERLDRIRALRLQPAKGRRSRAKDIDAFKREEQLRSDPGWENRVRAIDTQMEELMRGVSRGWGGSERSNPLGPA